MFVAGTQIFTDSGWKNIEDVAGRDRVLVRNFLGDAEFIQPFALKKKKYEGKVIKMGAKDWSFTVTPEHPISYSINGNFYSATAGDFTLSVKKRIYRKFKYMFSEEPQREIIRAWDDFGARSVTISPYDWYKLVAFTVSRGFIRMKPGRPMLWFFLDPEKVEEETRTLQDIFDRIGLGWHVQHTEKTRPKFVVSSKNTLARRMINRLGQKRKEMSLPDKMIYNTNKELAKLFIETFLELHGQTGKVQIVTTNKKLIDSLTLLGTLSGYSVRHSLVAKAGLEVRGSITKKDSYMLLISNIIETYSATSYKKLTYSGYVYGIDLFEGQVYVKQKLMPTWVSPK